MKALPIVLLFLTHMSFNVLANVGFKLSAAAPNFKGVLTWQVVGNVAGFCGVLAITALYRFTPMHVAFPISQGLAVAAVQFFAARLFFKETLGPTQWAGTAFVAIGIVLLSLRRPA